MVVYKITNKVNGHCYVGVTVRTLENRWIRHKSSARRGSQSPIHRAMRKYGDNVFVIQEVACATSIQDLKFLEMMFIQELNTYNSSHGYNATRGGDGTWGRYNSSETRVRIRAGLVKARSEGRFLNAEWYINMLAARKRQVGVPLSEQHKQNISNSLKGKAKSPLAGKQAVPVDQYDTGGTFVRTFDSYGEAARSINSNPSDVMRCCQGKRKVVKGYVFKYHNAIE